MSDNLPLIALLGAAGTGAVALALELQQRIGPSAARIVCPIAAGDYPRATLTLLMGLDLPCPPEERRTREAADAQLRAALADARVGYRVVYGLGERRIENALSAIKTVAISAYVSSARGRFDSNSTSTTARLRAWNCEKCSDPSCEHRLFTALLEQRG